MVDVSADKARAARNKAFLTNIRYMQEKVIAIKNEDKYNKEQNVISPANQDKIKRKDF